MKTSYRVESRIEVTPRVQQVRGLFDLQAEPTSTEEWQVDLPLEEQPWLIGLITGPSGSGKSTLARQLWPRALEKQPIWKPGQSILDGFPAGISIKEITLLLSNVGFASPPAWLRPYQVLSTGQQFRVNLARLLAEAMAQPCSSDQPVVVDEYTSVIDRTVAQIGSAALARVIRKQKIPFVAVSCHDDIIPWLQPDWIYAFAERRFTWRCLQRRPTLRLRIVRCEASAWSLFARHHYLNQGLQRSAACFLATWEGRPVAFSAWLPFVGKGPPTRREHRTVTLPDFQGVGIGGAVSATIASLWRGLGYRAISTTTHPALIRSRLVSQHWKMRRRPSLAASRCDGAGMRHASTRLTAGFEFIGNPMAADEARRLLGGM